MTDDARNLQEPRMDAQEIIGRSVELGYPLTDAVARALGEPLATWADRHGLDRTAVTQCLLRYPNRPWARIRELLASDLGVEREDVDGWIDDTAPSRA